MSCRRSPAVKLNGGALASDAAIQQLRRYQDRIFTARLLRQWATEHGFLIWLRRRVDIADHRVLDLTALTPPCADCGAKGVDPSRRALSGKGVVVARVLEPTCSKLLDGGGRWRLAEQRIAAFAPIMMDAAGANSNSRICTLRVVISDHARNNGADWTGYILETQMKAKRLTKLSFRLD
jgi:hypothetical protein